MHEYKIHERHHEARCSHQMLNFHCFITILSKMCTVILILTSINILIVPGITSHSTGQILRFRIYIISRLFPLGRLMLRVSNTPQSCSRTNGRCASTLYSLATRVMETV